MTITSSQGIVVYSTHLGWLGARAKPTAASETRFYRFAFQPRLYQGDWLVELAVAANQVEMCDVRSKLVHITPPRPLSGLAMLDTGLPRSPSR